MPTLSKDVISVRVFYPSIEEQFGFAAFLIQDWVWQSESLPPLPSLDSLISYPAKSFSQAEQHQGGFRVLLLL